MSDNFLYGDSSLPRSMGRGMAQRLLGLSQLGAEIFGQQDTDFYRATQRAAKNIREQGKGTGATGFVGEVLGDPLTYLAAPAAAGARGITGLSKLGFVGGGIEGGTRALEEGETRQGSVMQGQIGGTVAAPVMAGGFKLVGKVGDLAVNKTTDALKPIYKQGKSLMNHLFSESDEASQKLAIEVSGINTRKDLMKAVKDMGDDAIKSAKMADKSGLSPKESYLFAKAQKSGINLTRGQVKQDPILQRREDLARMGVLTDDAAAVGNKIQGQQQAAMQARAGELLSDATGDPSGALSVNKTDVGADFASSVKAKASVMKEAADLAYSADTQAKVPIEAMKDLPGNIRADLTKKGFDIGDMPKVQRHLGTMKRATKLLEKRGGTVKYQAAETFKKRLYKASESAGDNAERAALKQMHSQYAQRLDDIITNDLLINPDEAAKTLRKAPALWKDYKQTFFGQDGKAALGKIVKNDMTDRQVADLFGSSLFGKGDTQKVVGQIRNVFGDQSPEMGQVRGMFLNRVFKDALDNPRQEFGVAVRSNIDRFRKENKALYDDLFSPELQKEIDDFADIAYLIGNQVRSKTNPSGSGMTVLGAQSTLLSKLGTTGQILDQALRGISKEVTQGREAKKAMQSMLEPLKEAGSDSRVISESLRNVFGAASGVQQGGQVIDALNTAPQTEAQPQQKRIQLPDGFRKIDPKTMQPVSQVPDHILREEGLELSSYNDTEGVRTVGIGFNMESPHSRGVWKSAGIDADFNAVKAGKQSISQADAVKLAQASTRIALDDVKALVPNYYDLSPRRREALLNMSYQLGRNRLSEFKNMLGSVRDGNFIRAAEAVRNSKYARQTPERANRIAAMLLSG